jgi:ABC-type branched-subunit amino acid transport system permease subunit
VAITVLSGLQNIPGLEAVSQATLSLWFFWASALALGAGYVFFAWMLSGKFGSVIRAIRDNEARIRFLGYNVENYKLLIFTVTAMIAGIAGGTLLPASRHHQSRGDCPNCLNLFGRLGRRLADVGVFMGR